jgi:hypothetical protein
MFQHRKERRCLADDRLYRAILTHWLI